MSGCRGVKLGLEYSGKLVEEILDNVESCKPRRGRARRSRGGRDDQRGIEAVGGQPEKSAVLDVDEKTMLGKEIRAQYRLKNIGHVELMSQGERAEDDVHCGHTESLDLGAVRGNQEARGHTGG